jgi:hypothetical protein
MGITLISMVVILLWLGIWPWSSYAGCGTSVAPTFPGTIQVGFYEEFPTADRLEKLHQLDFPAHLAVASTSRDEFLQIRRTIEETYPQIQQVLFWPLLSTEEGYYPGSWSKADGIARLINEASGLPTLWDLEWPRQGYWFPLDWPANRALIDRWLKERIVPVHIWRSQAFLGLDARSLSLLGMHFDPIDYPAVYLHLDLYTTGQGLPDALLRRVLRCGVETYGEHFIPSFGMLDDHEGPTDRFIPAATLRRYLQAARQAGVSEVWLFGANGLNETYLVALHETLPLAVEPTREAQGTAP